MRRTGPLLLLMSERVDVVARLMNEGEYNKVKLKLYRRHEHVVSLLFTFTARGRLTSLQPSKSVMFSIFSNEQPPPHPENVVGYNYDLIKYYHCRNRYELCVGPTNVDRCTCLAFM